MHSVTVSPPSKKQPQNVETKHTNQKKEKKEKQSNTLRKNRSQTISADDLKFSPPPPPKLIRHKSYVSRDRSPIIMLPFTSPGLLNFHEWTQRKLMVNYNDYKQYVQSPQNYMVPINRLIEMKRQLIPMCRNSSQEVLHFTLWFTFKLHILWWRPFLVYFI